MQNTKKSLVLSAVSLLLFVAMLVGTTFAWFTDSATSGKNKLVAGNLDVDLLMDKAENGTYTSIGAAEAEIFGGESSLVAQNDSTDTLWEPGKTQIVYLGVRNLGTLALMYNIKLTVTDEGLASALEYAIIDGAKAADLASVTDWTTLKANAQTGNLCDLTFDATTKKATVTAAEGGVLDEIVNGTENETDYFALAVHMKEDAGNEYKNKDIVIDLVVDATQYTAEKDSFDNQYDKIGSSTPTKPSNESEVVAGKDTVLEVKKDSKVFAKATVPADSFTGSDTCESLGMTVTSTFTPDGISTELMDYETASTYDISFYIIDDKGVKHDVSTFTSSVNVSIDLSGVLPENQGLKDVYHTNAGDSVLLTRVQDIASLGDGKYYYDNSTGMMTVGSKTFSPFTFVTTGIHAPEYKVVGDDYVKLEEIPAPLGWKTQYAVRRGNKVNEDNGIFTLYPTDNGDWQDGTDFDDISKDTFYFFARYIREGYDTVVSNGTKFTEPDCLAAGTKITMADGTLKNIEDITEGDKVLTYNHEKGVYEGQSVYLAWACEAPKTAFTLHFTNGVDISVIGDHCFFEKESLAYAAIFDYNAEDFVGKHFYNAAAGRYEELLSVTYGEEPVMYYEIYTEYNANCIAEGMLNVAYDTVELLNIYKFNEDLTADMAQLQSDIAEFGLMEYPANADYSEELFDALGWKYVYVMIGKGFGTWDEFIARRDAFLAD